MEEDKEKTVIDTIKLIEDLAEQLGQCSRLVDDSEMRRVLAEAEVFLTSAPHPEAREEDIAESEATSHELGAGRFVHGISKPIEISQVNEPIVWQLDFAATLPWGEEIEGIEGEGSWFLIDQRGKVWEYGPTKAPAPLGNEYTRAIPLLKVGDNYMTWAEIISRLAAPKPEGQDVVDILRAAADRAIVWSRKKYPDGMESKSAEEISAYIEAGLMSSIMEPAAPEPRPDEEPAPAPSEEDDPLESAMYALETAGNLGSSVVLDPEEIVALRSQLARKDEGLKAEFSHDYTEGLLHLGCPAQIWCLSMCKCVDVLLSCDAVLFLEGWEHSAGARREHDLALEHGKTIYYYSL